MPGAERRRDFRNDPFADLGDEAEIGAPPVGPSGYLEPGRQDQAPYATQTPPYEQQRYTPPTPPAAPQPYTPPVEQAPWQQSQTGSDLGYTPPAEPRAPDFPGMGDASGQASAPSSDSDRNDTL